MWDFLKEIARSINAVALLLFVLLLIIAILGFIPIKTDSVTMHYLTSRQRISFIILAIVILAIPGLISLLTRKPGDKPPENKDYNEGFHQARAKEKDIIPAKDILAQCIIKGSRLVVFNDNILNANVDVLVSSDDNFFQAKGGVAKSLLDKAGPEIRKELKHYGNLNPKLAHGNIAVTAGGLTGARAIIHPVVIDLVKQRFPDEVLVRKIVRRSLMYAEAFGAETIALPVLGGGTASNFLTPWNSIRAILAECLDYLQKPNPTDDHRLTDIALYVFDRKDVTGDLNALLSQPAQQREPGEPRN